jgi:hypothetical protein
MSAIMGELRAVDAPTGTPSRVQRLKKALAALPPSLGGAGIPSLVAAAKLGVVRLCTQVAALSHMQKRLVAPDLGPRAQAVLAAGLAATPWCVITAARLRRYNAVITAAPAPLRARA